MSLARRHSKHHEEIPIGRSGLFLNSSRPFSTPHFVHIFMMVFAVILHIAF